MSRKIELFIGLNDKVEKVQKVSTDEALAFIFSNVEPVAPYGFTCTQSLGMYKHEDGSLVYESTIKVEIITDNEGKDFELLLQNVINNLKYDLNQEAILKVVTECEYECEV